MKYMENRRVVCNLCKSPIHKCPNCDQELFQVVSKKMPDFICSPLVYYVEAKNSNATGRWDWTEISKTGEKKHQREFLLINGGWLFIELGTKPAPKGKSAYLIPMLDWVTQVEPILIEKDMKSIRKETKGNRPGGDELMERYRLEWSSPQNYHKEWYIPMNHDWWVAQEIILKNLLHDTQKMLT